MTAKLVVFEGPDKVGKETQSKLLLRSLKDASYNVVRCEVPTNACPRTYKLIYSMLKSGWAKRTPNLFQFIQFLNKWLFQVLHMPSLMRNNDVVILDRWSLSAVIYGGATGVNSVLNMFLFNRLKKPDITIVLDGQSFRRSTTEDDSYEKDNELQAAVKVAYHQWALDHSNDHVLAQNNASKLEVHYDILIALRMAGIP